MACEEPHIGARRLESMAMGVYFNWAQSQAFKELYPNTYTHGVSVGRLHESLTQLMGCTKLSEGHILLLIARTHTELDGQAFPTDVAKMFAYRIALDARAVPTCNPV